MKKTIALLLALLFALAAFSGCAPKDDAPVKIGFAAPAATHGWVAGIAYYAEKYCRENNIEYNITVSADAEEMTSALTALADWGADVIILWPQWTGMESAVADIIKKGIKVICFDIDVDTEGVYKVTGNNYDMGYQSAKYICERAGEAATIAVLDVPSSGSVAELRKQGFYAYLDEINYDKSNIFEIAQEGFSRDCGYADMKKILDEHETVDAVFSLDDESSIGVVKAIEEAGRTDVKAVTGGGGMQEYFYMIMDDKYESLGLASALYSPSMIIDAIKTAIALENGEECESLIVIPTTVVTSKNVGDYFDPYNKIY